MKKLLLTLIIMGSVVISAQAQEKLKIGVIKNGKLTITNPDGFKGYIANSLENSGTFGKDYQVSFAPEGNRCFVIYPVSGNSKKVSSIGVMLVVNAGEAFIVENPPQTLAAGPGGGGSFEVQCVGVDCSSCAIDIKWINGNWLPIVYCNCSMPGDGTCNMISKVIFHIEAL
jgi:hypothetical protein